jgi:hypothetical protein
MAQRSVTHIFCILILLGISSGQDKKQPADSFGSTFKPVRTQFSLSAKQLAQDAGQRSEHEYDIVAVNRLLIQTRNGTLSRIPDEALPVRDYVDKRIPSSFPLNRSVSSGAVEQVLDSIEHLLASLTQMSTLRLNLTIKTTPANAKFELIPSVGPPITIGTDDRITNLYRGEYAYVVTKSGYKEIREKDLNLIERSGDLFECDLQPDNQPDQPLPCRLR